MTCWIDVLIGAFIGVVITRLWMWFDMDNKLP